MRTLKAPNGVTNIGGANVYAAKLATVKAQYSHLALSDIKNDFIMLTFSQDYYNKAKVNSGATASSNKRTR
jgi:hypothetical protein